MTFRLSASSSDEPTIGPAVINDATADIQGFPAAPASVNQHVDADTDTQMGATLPAQQQLLVGVAPTKASTTPVEQHVEEVPSDLQQEVQRTKQLADEKKVVMDKIGLFKPVFNLVKAAVDIASDVSARLPISRTLSNPYAVQVHPAVKLATAALDSLMEVRFFIQGRDGILSLGQACEQQEAARDAAKDLMSRFDDYLQISTRTNELATRKETERAVRRMTEVIGEACQYVREKTHSGVFRESKPLLGTPN